MEKWLPIPGFEGYAEVSDTGQIRSVDREYSNRLGVRRVFKGQLIHPYVRTDGYLAANLPSRSGQQKIAVHRAVLMAFVGPCPDGMQGCHKDGNRQNARLENLRWDSIEANHADKRRHGTHLEGEQIANAKLNQQAVREILTSTETSKILARRFGVAGSAVRAVRCGKNWRHVKKDAA